MDHKRMAELTTTGSTRVAPDPDHQNLVYATARGEFDVDSVSNLTENLNQSPSFLNPERLVMVTFVESCRGSDEFFEALDSQVRRVVCMGFAAKRMAFVLAPEIDGQSEYIARYRQIYTKHNFKAEFSDTADTAKAWLLAESV